MRLCITGLWPQIAEQYIHTLPPEIAGFGFGVRESALSTMDEAAQAGRCLDAVGARSVLVVTSEYHTRRALSVFRHVFPDRSIGVAGAVEPDQFGVRWWRHRQWAKVTLKSGRACSGGNAWTAGD